MTEESDQNIEKFQLDDLHRAILDDELDLVEQICGQLTDINEPFGEKCSVKPHIGMTALGLSAAFNKTQMATILLNAGASPNVPFAQLRTTALMTAAYHGHADIVQILLKAGSDITAVDLQQSSALGYALGGSRNLDVIQKLIRAGLNVNNKNMLGMNALLLVSGYGDPTLVQILLKAGALPDATNDFGHSALHLAVAGKREQLKKARMQYGDKIIQLDAAFAKRNLDTVMVQWARSNTRIIPTEHIHKNVDKIVEAAKLISAIGQYVENTTPTDNDQQMLQRRLAAVWKYRQQLVDEAREYSKPTISSILACGVNKPKPTPKSTKHLPLESPNLAAVPYELESEIAVHINDSCAAVVKLLIEAGCPIDKMEETFGMTALDMSVLHGDIQSATLLTAAGAQPLHLVHSLALNDLYCAILSVNSRKDVKNLLLHDVHLDVNMPFTRLNISTKNDNSKLDTSFASTIPPDNAEVDDEGLTPLAVACRRGLYDIAKLLMKNGARTDGFGNRSPLIEAICSGQKKIVELLIENKCDLEARCPFYDNATPLSVAVMFIRPAILQILLKNGAKVDASFANGMTPLLKAFALKNSLVLTTLLQADRDKCFIDIDGWDSQMAGLYQSKNKDDKINLMDLGAQAVAEFEAREGISTSPPKGPYNRQDNEMKTFSQEITYTPTSPKTESSFVTSVMEAGSLKLETKNNIPTTVDEHKETIIEDKQNNISIVNNSFKNSEINVKEIENNNAQSDDKPIPKPRPRPTPLPRSTTSSSSDLDKPEKITTPIDTNKNFVNVRKLNSSIETTI